MTEEKTKRRYKLILEFDGSRYSGWQSQKDADTIQGTLQQAAGELVQGRAKIQGCGRTDRGVHAMAYTAHLEATTSMAAPKIMAGLNKLLPKDIAVLEAKKAGPRFHARHNCVARSYIYRFSSQKSVFDRKYVWYKQGHLDATAMAAAATLFAGMHDFSSFTDPKILAKKSPLVQVIKTELFSEDGLLVFRIVGSHFLWKMVRRCAGVLAAVGQGELTVGEVEMFITNPGLTQLKKYTAPAQGLFFERAFYNDEELQDFITPGKHHAY